MAAFDQKICHQLAQKFFYEDPIAAVEFQGPVPIMIARPKHIAAILQRLRNFPVVVLPGARQFGWPTFVRLVAKEYKKSACWFDQEEPIDLAGLEDPAPAPIHHRRD